MHALAVDPSLSFNSEIVHRFLLL